MLGTCTLASILGGRPGVRLVRRAFEPKDEITFAENAPPAEDARVVEGATLRAIPTADTGETGFTHFVDGAQKSRLAFFDGPMPGYLAHVSAAVLRRESRDMTEVVAEEQLLAVFAPARSGAFADVLREGLQARPVACPEDAGMSAMIELVKNRISTTREDLEAGLKLRWLKDSSALAGAASPMESPAASTWLLADGGIAQIAAACPGFHRIAGVVKSHRKQYFCSQITTEVVLGLRAGERTSVFVAKTGSQDLDEAYSWYLRLREETDESPAFGLVRVEMPACDESLEWVDRVSSWLMAERAPLSLPDPRFDRMLYPIRRVEMYLKSRQPSAAMLTALVGA